MTRPWVAGHRTGPLATGTLIGKPLRHCLHLWDLSGEPLNIAAVEQSCEKARELLRVSAFMGCPFLTGVCTQRPVNLGGRFSMKARGPSGVGRW